MRNVVLIHNPAAARHRQRVVETIQHVLQENGCDVRLVAIQRQGHAKDIAAEAVNQRVDVVAVYGGDGTMIQAVEGLVGSDVMLGLVPGGTGNLLAANLGVPRNPRAAAKVIAHGHARRIDLGRLDTPDGIRYFAVACGAGYDAEVMANTSSQSKRRLRMLAYVVSIIRKSNNIRALGHRIVVDGEAHNIDASTVLIANCRKIIPGILDFGTNVAPDDGMLDLVALKADGFLDATVAMWGLFRRKENGRVRRLRGSKITVEPNVPRPVQLDGEEAGRTPFTASVIRNGLSVLVPEKRL